LQHWVFWCSLLLEQERNRLNNPNVRLIAGRTVQDEVSMALVYLLFGLSMVVALLIAIGVYYSRSRKKEVEEPKYRMLDDDDD
jgi:formate hydrogenlyase subunit 3/multisubunit Na+/H+ antiporter MnhD subunit